MVFSWGRKEIPSTDEHATYAGAANASPVAASLAADSRAEAERELQTTARRRGRPSKSTDAGAGDSPRISPALAEEIAKQLEACYDPKVWGALLCAPGDMMMVFTGREHWKLSSEERATLGATGSAAARTMMIQNPRALAFLMLGSALFSAYVPRMLVEMRHLKKEKDLKGKPDAAK